MKKGSLFLSCLFISFFAVQMSYPHCQIPCGIYDDKMRIQMIDEHIDTIEKSMRVIVELSKESPPNYNQIVRWVQNKEDHADELSHIISFYFMAQRVKPVDDTDSKEYSEYIKKLAILHGMIVSSMKAKQTIDLDHIGKLRKLLADFKGIYFKPAEEEKK